MQRKVNTSKFCSTIIANSIATSIVASIGRSMQALPIHDKHCGRFNTRKSTPESQHPKVNTRKSTATFGRPATLASWAGNPGQILREETPKR